MPRESCWNDPWKTNKPYWLTWHPLKGEELSQGLIQSHIFTFSEYLWYIECCNNSFFCWSLLKYCWVYRKRTINVLSLRLQFIKQLSSFGTAIDVKSTVEFHNMCHTVFFVFSHGFWVIVSLPLSACFSQITPPPWGYLHVTWRVLEIGVDVLVWKRECLSDVYIPFIVTQAIKCLGRANHWRDSEKKEGSRVVKQLQLFPKK